ncbi:NmrA/HSCARG family protein [Kribbella sp. NPDC058693]|uniref:NmrA/HSCARG family protein n=1 Tax=Kribbella sp. NPDC058693 TaxID=3346602 RepID=UPI003647E2F7
MTDKKIIAVVGATGAQGGGLVRAILADADSPFAVRALTRNPGSDKARALAAAGAEVVQADLDDAESVVSAFTGAYGAFVVTNFWEERAIGEEDTPEARGDKEFAQADTAARAAAEAGLKHVVWSTLDDTRKFFGDDTSVPSLGKYKVPHFDAKADANELFVKYGVPTTLLNTTFYFEGFMSGLALSRDKDGKAIVILPMADAPLAGVAAEDIGKTAYAIFRDSAAFIGKTVGLAGDHLTGEQYARALSVAMGEEVSYRPPTWDEYRAQPWVVAVEAGNMFEYYARNHEQYTGERSPDAIRRINPDLQSFDDWLAAHPGQVTVS